MLSTSLDSELVFVGLILAYTMPFTRLCPRCSVNVKKAGCVCGHTFQPGELSLKCRPGNDRCVLRTRISATPQNFVHDVNDAIAINGIMPVGPESQV